MKTSLSSKYSSKYHKSNTFIVANTCHKISGRGKNCLYAVCEKKRWQNLSEIVLICMVQTTLIPAISLVTKEHTFNGIVDKTFNIWRDGFVYMMSLKKRTLSDRVYQNLIFEKKFKMR